MASCRFFYLYLPVIFPVARAQQFLTEDLPAFTGEKYSSRLTVIAWPKIPCLICFKFITMQSNNFERRVKERGDIKDHGNKNVYNGIILLIIGGILLADRAGVDFPNWFLSWPMILIGIGIFSGLRHNFKKGPWFILILIGGIFLADKISENLNIRPYFWPIIFIAAGLYVISGGKLFGRNRGLRNEADNISDLKFEDVSADNTTTDSETEFAFRDTNDVIDITAIFSGVKKNVLSKNFKGGDVVAIMGGAEINVTKADISTKAVIDVFTMFGGTKIIVPPDWDVQSNVVAIFGGVDDKRPPSSLTNLSKVIYLEGTCIFGGIEIRSF